MSVLRKQHIKDPIEELNETPNFWAVNMVWIGFSIYMIAFAASMSTRVSYSACQAMQIVGMVLFIGACPFILRWTSENQYLKTVFTIYMIWMVFTLLRGLSLDYEALKLLLLMPQGGIFVYLAPLMVMFPCTPKALKSMFKTMIVLAFFYGVLCVAFYQIVLYGALGSRESTGIFEYFSQYLVMATSFIFMTFLYHRKMGNFFALGAILLAFVLAAIRARRGLMMILILMLVSGYILFLKNNKGNKTLTTFMSVMMIIMVGMYAFFVFQNNKGGMFGLIVSRMDEDTRTGVEKAFYASMDLPGWIFGRGSSGKYYCPGIDEGYITIYRSVIETGYLQVILNGGLISLILWVMLVLPAAIKGIFKSNNLLCKACGVWNLLFMFFTYPTVIHAFTLSYVLIWFSVAICFNDKMRALSDDELKEAFFNT